MFVDDMWYYVWFGLLGRWLFLGFENFDFYDCVNAFIVYE